MSNNGKDFSSKADLIKQIYEKFEKGGLSKVNQQTIVTLTSKNGWLDGEHDADLEKLRSAIFAPWAK